MDIWSFTLYTVPFTWNNFQVSVRNRIFITSVRYQSQSRRHELRVPVYRSNLISSECSNAPSTNWPVPSIEKCIHPPAFVWLKFHRKVSPFYCSPTLFSVQVKWYDSTEWDEPNVDSHQETCACQ